MVLKPDGAIDTHQHVFPHLDRWGGISWLSAGDQPPHSTRDELATINDKAGVRGILIQAENRSKKESSYLMHAAAVKHDLEFAGAVVGIDMIQNPKTLREALIELKAERGFLGIRFLLECEHAAIIANNEGGIRDKFIESLKILAELGIRFEFCGWNWQHEDMLQVLEHAELQELPAVIDHCLKFQPDPATPGKLPTGFSAAMKRVAACPNAYVKWSELLKYVAQKGNGSKQWTIEAAALPMGTMLREVITQVGRDRVIWGSGWPVASWADHVEGTGDEGAITYDDVVRASLLAMEHIGLTQDDVDAIMRDNAKVCYRITD